ncbi:MAG: PIN domain-containing protein [Bacteroidia bacterium]
MKEVESFLSDVFIVEMNSSIKKIVIQLRRKYRIKLPDSIIAGTSIYLGMPLVSADKGFERIEELSFLKYVPE